MKTYIIFILLIMNLNIIGSYYANEKEPIVVSPLIGEKLDRVERNYFKLFPHFDGFEEAVFYLNPDSSLMVEIWYQTDDGIKDTVLQNYRSLSNLQYHIDQVISHPLPPTRQARAGSQTTITLSDSNTVSGELIETGKYHLQVYNPDYKIPGTFDMGSSGYNKVNFNDIKEIRLIDTTNIAPPIFGAVGGVMGLLFSLIESGGSNQGFAVMGSLLYIMVGSAIGGLLGYIFPIDSETEINYELPLNEKDIKGLKVKTKKY